MKEIGLLAELTPEGVTAHINMLGLFADKGLKSHVEEEMTKVSNWLYLLPITSFAVRLKRDSVDFTIKKLLRQSRGRP